ncbi:MAG: CBS domain-containing protein [Gemmatimonadetes bacterium]|nr:CBS domain-containing protein [Gemmatimonadota bacterium]NIO32097.1 CBS domain-containing protein [Gemmatimonadota bacterium]
MTGGIRICRFFGFEVRLDYSWFVVFLLVLWTFAQSVFPGRTPGLSAGTYFTMALVGASLFFASVLLHELAHSAMARARGIQVEGITLFIFGGMARIRSEATNPKDEFLITVVGPLSSALIGGVLLVFARVGDSLGLHRAFVSVAEYLAILNFILALFNLIPGFPLDGGRLLRSLVWQITKDVRKATRLAAFTGQGFGYLMIGFGILSLFRGFLVSGIWLIFIGWFLSQAAAFSYRQLVMRRILQSVQVKEAMTRNPETVAPDVTLRDLVDNYFLMRRYSAFPVLDSAGRPLGLITLRQVKEIERDKWPTTQVSSVMTQICEAVTVRPDDSLAQVLTKLEKAGVGRALVVRDGRLEGLISNADVATWLDRYQQLH